jgi:integrase
MGSNRVKHRKRPSCADEVEGMKLGVHPFAYAAKLYMERRFGLVGDNTYREEERKYRYLAQVFEFLKDEGMIGTTNPRLMGRKEVQAFMWWMRSPDAIKRFKDKNSKGPVRGRPRAIAPSAQQNYLKLVNNLLKANKNFIIEEMKAEGVRFPKGGDRAIRVIDEADLDKILATIDTMEGWRGSMARGMMPLYFATGVRPSELRFAYLEDLDLENGTLFIQKPKGAGSWAEPEMVCIVREDMLPYIRRYVVERSAYLKEKGREDAEALFPSLSSPSGFYSAQGFIAIKAKVESLSGVKFALKDFRPTLTSMTINGDIKLLPVMSAQLRHKDIKTTQKSYWQTQRGVAGKQLRDEWNSRGIREKQYTPISEDI